MAFTFEQLRIPDLIKVLPESFEDLRGSFSETYRLSSFAEAGIFAQFVQDNASMSKAGVLRGLHYQLPPHAQAKLVRVTRGKIFDVAVDIRRNSKTFGCWAGCVLSAENRQQLYIPVGFAHGFVVLSDCADVAYKTDSEYSAEHERGIRYDDPTINIEWPYTHQPLTVSPKDRDFPLFGCADLFDESKI